MNTKGRPSIKHREKLAYVADFLRLLGSQLSHGPGEPTAAGLWFSRRPHGSLFLTSSETEEYRATVSRLRETFAKTEDLSRSSIERFVVDSIFAVLAIGGTDNRPLDDRVNETLDRLHAQLTATPQAHRCIVPVNGVDVGGLPARFGPARFLVLNSSQIRRFPNFRDPRPDVAAAAARSLRKHLRETDGWGKPAVEVMVRARDLPSALALGRRRARRVVDAVNFFSDLIPYADGWIYLPSEATPVKTGLPIMREDGAMNVQFISDGPLEGFSFARLRAERPLLRAFRRLSGLSRIEQRSPLARTILSAVEWAGRATVEPKREQAFMLFAIALETLVLPEMEPRELSYRLRTRTAHLLGRTRAERTELSARVNKLYETRSKIVHSGSYEVTEDALGQIRSIVKRAILRVLLHRQLGSVTTAGELAEWFESKVLR
jgi:hypothetical protein